jgi:hypothetical protein
MRTCFLSSQMNPIGGFSAPLNGSRRGHPSKTMSQEKQEQRNGMSGARSMTDVEHLVARRDAARSVLLGSKPHGG